MSVAELERLKVIRNGACGLEPQCRPPVIALERSGSTSDRAMLEGANETRYGDSSPLAPISAARPLNRSTA